MTDKPMYATRDFNDAGTEKSFTRGEKITAKAGELANYAAAGLASEEKPQDEAPQADEKPAATARTKAA